jgi:23S rRNA pseudouridine2605 synthase/23S rRNA pseudouridine2604 synthase
MRLQKYIASAGVCSRRQAEFYIRDGRVAVNGRVITQMGVTVDPEADKVAVDGRPVVLNRPAVYIALNKPAGYVSSCLQRQEKTILELVDVPERIYPVGRLDKESTGLILLTNDGGLHLALSHPSYDHEKEYEVTLAAPVSDEDLAKLRAGVRIDGRKTRPAKVSRVSDRRFRIILLEGRNRQIRKMTGSLGLRVTALKRLRMAGIRLGSLKEGQWRHLTGVERNSLLRETGVNSGPSGGRSRN